MKVKELIEKLQKCDSEKEAFIKFGLDKNDKIGYWLEIAFVEDILDDCIIYAEYTATKEDCDFVIILKIMSLIILMFIELILMRGYVNEIKEDIVDSSTNLVLILIGAFIIPILYITMT